jgi:hypothetical protein
MSRHGRHGPASSERAQEQLRRLEKARDERRRADLRAILTLPEGRRFLLDLIERRCGVSGTGFDPSGSMTYFLCGQRSVGIELREDMKALEPNRYCEMFVDGIHAAAEEMAQRRLAEATAKTDGPDGPIEEDES